MPHPVSYRELLRKLRRAGCLGPFSGSKHAYFLHGRVKIIIPNDHGCDVGPKVLKRIIADLDMSINTFEEL